MNRATTTHIGEARRAVRDATGATQTQIVLVWTPTGEIAIAESIAATRQFVAGDGAAGIHTDLEALAVAPYNRLYRVENGIADWGWAVVWADDEDGAWREKRVERVRRDWYERPRHQSPCVPSLLSPIYRTQARADAVLAGIIAACVHDWIPVSHEEDRCMRCGTFRCVPDID